MLVEMKLSAALKNAANGIPVKVMAYKDGICVVQDFEDLLPVNARFLVDIPEEVAAADPVEVPVEEPISDQPETKEEILVPIEKPKSKKQIVRELMEQGLTNQEIIKKTGFNDNTVYQVRYEMKKEKGEYPTGAQC